MSGTYEDSKYFGDPKSDEGYATRLAARIQIVLELLASDLRQKGDAHEIVNEGSITTLPDQPQKILRQDALENVRVLMSRSGGAQLLGTVNTKVVPALFMRQAEPWSAILENCAQKILHAIREATSSIIDYVADRDSAKELLEHVIEPALAAMEQELLAKIDQSLEQHRDGHMAIYHKVFSENVNKVRQESRNSAISQKLHSFFDVEPGSAQASGPVGRTIGVTSLLDKLCADEGADALCVDTLDCIQAYYKVSILELVRVPFWSMTKLHHSGRDAVHRRRIRREHY